MTTPNTITAAQNWLANTSPPADYETNSLQKQFSFTPEKPTIHHGPKGYTIFADDNQQRHSVPYQAPKDDEYSYDFHTRKVASEHKVSSKPIEERPKQSSPHKVAYKNLFTEDQQRDSYKTEGALTARTFSPIAYQATPEKEKKSSTDAAFKSLFSNEESPISYHQSVSYQTPQKPSPVKGEIILKGNEQPKLLKERETLIREFRAQYLLNNQGEYKPNVEKQQYEENCYYEGNFAYDRKTGKGVYFYANGDAYMGDWVDNYFHGTGTYFFVNGERYEGQLENGMKHGKGTYHYLDFKRYSGEWINDRKHGKGVYDYYGIKEKYDGDFVKGKRHGMGTYYYANGDKWFGQWRNNERVETDVKEPIEITKSIEIKEPVEITKPIEVRETVEMKKPVEIPQERVVRKAAPPQLQKKNTITSAQLRGDGEGIIIFPNTDTFEGRWKSGLFYGMGVYSYSNGDRYEGEWKDSFKNGQGTLTIDRTQDKYVGSWQRDQQNGQGVLSYGDGDRYEGEWRHGRRHGFGTMMFKNGDVYTGQWENGFRQGRGVYKFHNGDTYEGSWQHDRKNGNGIYRWKDGSKYDGLWVNDEIDQNQLHYSGYYDASQPTGPIQPDAHLHKNLYL